MTDENEDRSPDLSDVRVESCGRRSLADFCRTWWTVGEGVCFPPFDFHVAGRFTTLLNTLPASRFVVCVTAHAVRHSYTPSSYTGHHSGASYV
jgi:hypothetical protein